ncbi:MAG: hypothetical protein JO180_12250 [Gemmatirosa sp.]|nr:hypothetical protein [Gemmatirosa sp.]
MTLPLIIGALAVLLVLVLAGSLRGRQSTGPVGRQTALIVLVLVVVAALVLYVVFLR